MLFNIALAFVQEAQMNARATKIAEAFGIGLEQRTFSIFNNVEIDIRPGDIVYITGDSGGGKSLLSKELERRLAQFKHIFGDICTEKELR